MAVKKGLEVTEFMTWSRQVAELKVGIGEKIWRILVMYSQSIEETMKIIKTGIEEREEECLVLGGDFNARVGEEGGPFREIGNEQMEDGRSKYKIMNAEGRKLIEEMKERSWIIVNGCFGSEGSWTHVGGSATSIIDYVIGNERALEEIVHVTEGDRTESDHVPLEVWVSRTEQQWEQRIIEKTMDGEVKRCDWTVERIKFYHESCKVWEAEGANVEDTWK